MEGSKVLPLVQHPEWLRWQFSPRLQYGSNVIFKVKVADSSLRKQMHSC